MSEIKEFDIVPKYKIGQTVYQPLATWDYEMIQCPDCLEEKFWELKLPNGEESAVPCKTCTPPGFAERPNGMIKEYSYQARVQELTIGSIRIDTNDQECKVIYMCKETGIGSGTLHKEIGLFDNESEAIKAANDLAVKKNDERIKAEEIKREEGKRSA